ncbi:MAG: flagellar biosynthesis protein FlhF [Nitrospirae bacterium]|nr:flagellar biosynthesis protein FlhF [Nitrospirota bacterium]
MQIKKYEAVDMQEALKLIKRDLGPDAVILSTREIKKGNGIFGMFSRQVVEVTAARDYSEKVKDKAIAAYSPLTHPSPPFINVGEGKGEGLSEDLLKEEINRIKADFGATPVELREVKTEIGVLKSYVQELLRTGEDEQLKGLPDKLVIFYRKLVSEGIDVTLSGRIVRILDSKLSEEQKNNFEQINRLGYELIQKQVKVSGPVYNIEKGQKIAVFVGPTGVGKTTTIAKIAAKYTLVDKKKVALVTFDTFRIGAIEQLKIYAKIIGLPVDVVLTPDELPEVVEKRRDADIILIDTAGRNHKDRDYIKEIKAMWSHRLKPDCYLVLASTSSNEVLTDVINRFREIPVSGLLFTKLDEAEKFGIIFNAMIKAQKPLSYFTTGQRVPEDIEPAEAQRLSRLILGMEGVNSH